MNKPCGLTEEELEAIIIDDVEQDRSVLTEETTGDSPHGINENTLIYSDELKQAALLSRPAQEELSPKRVFLGERTKRYTLVLDLDQTLVHSSEVHPRTSGTEGVCSFAVKVRPFVSKLLEQMSKIFELVVFTAAEEVYAKPVVGIIDPENKYLKKVICRQNCIQTPQGFLVKDLRIFADREVNEILIVDDNVLSFAFQLANGIPILPFNGEEEDDELNYLMEYLNEIYEEKDLIKVNREKIGLVPVEQ